MVVPERATSGRLRAVNDDGRVRRPAGRSSPSSAEGQLGRARRKVVGRRVYYDAARPARVDLLARRAMAVTVALVRVIDGAGVMAWPVALAPEEVSSITWDGRVEGVAQPAGRYEFGSSRASPARASSPRGSPRRWRAAALTSSTTSSPSAGATSTARAGGLRRAAHGHVHQGQDVFARCGTPLVAARGGA